MNNKNVIVNVRSGAPVTIMETRSVGSDLYLVGEFTTFDVMNRNKRIYRKDNYKNVFSQIADKCASGALLGELGHPDGRSATDLASVSHVVTRLEIDEQKNCVRGEIKLLDTPNGRIARTLVESGVPMYVSSRAAGYIGKGGEVTLTSLITYDLVDEPGFANARLSVRDITESYCGENDECENVAIFSCDGDNCPDCGCDNTATATATSCSLEDVMSSINSLRQDVRSLSSRVSAIESNRTCASSDAVSSDAISTIVDSRVEEALKCVYDNINALEDRQDGMKHYMDIKERLVSKSTNTSSKNDNRNIIKYLDYIAEEMTKREKYMDYIVKECNNHQKDVDYVVNECNKHEEYFDYIAKVINESQVETKGGNGSLARRVELVENYLESAGLELNKQERAMNEKFDKFIEYTDYIASTINENNDEVNLLQKFIDEEVVSTVNGIEKIANENRDFINEANHSIVTIDKSREAFNNRLNAFSDSVTEQLKAIEILHNDAEMNDVKRLLEKIEGKEAFEVQESNAIAKSQRNELLLERDEKRLRQIMHPSVVHIWESLDKDTKAKIASDMSTATGLAIQTQSLMLTRMINNYSVNR